MPPPEIAVVPPKTVAFSRTSTRRPPAAARTAAVSPAAPEPTMITSHRIANAPQESGCQSRTQLKVLPGLGHRCNDDVVEAGDVISGSSQWLSMFIAIATPASPLTTRSDEHDRRSCQIAG